MEPDLYRKVGYSEEAVAALMALASTTTVAPGTEYPALSVANVSSLASAAYKSKHFGNKYAHVFWGKADLWPHAASSLSPWELRTQEHGIAKGG